MKQRKKKIISNFLSIFQKGNNRNGTKNFVVRFNYPSPSVARDHLSSFDIGQVAGVFPA